MTATNVGPAPVATPLLVAVEHISNPQVSVVGGAGTLGDGSAYYDLGSLVPGGVSQPGQATGTQTLAFDDPDRQPFTYDLVFSAKRPPRRSTTRPSSSARRRPGPTSRPCSPGGRPQPRPVEQPGARVGLGPGLPRHQRQRRPRRRRRLRPTRSSSARSARWSSAATTTARPTPCRSASPCRSTGPTTASSTSTTTATSPSRAPLDLHPGRVPPGRGRRSRRSGPTSTPATPPAPRST